MPHDKIRSAARERMAQTGEPYAAARRAVMSERQLAKDGTPPPGRGYALGMSREIHDWLAALRDSDPPTAAGVCDALAALMREGGSLGAPLVVSPGGSRRHADRREALMTYEGTLGRLEIARRHEADAAGLVEELQHQVAELESALARLTDVRRRAWAAGRRLEAVQAVGELVGGREQLAEVRRLLAGVVESRRLLGKEILRLQARVDAFPVRREVLKSRYDAARGGLMARQAMAALAGDDVEHPQIASAEAISEARSRLAEVTAEMERELGPEIWPEGLMELRPEAPDDSDIRILFAVQPPDAALLVAVLEGLETAPDQYWEAVMLSAGVLQKVRAGQAPGTAAHVYASPQVFLQELHPANAGHTNPDSSPQ